MNIINAGSEHRILGTMLNSNKQLELISKIRTQDLNTYLTKGQKRGGETKCELKLRILKRSQFKNDEKLPYLH